MTYNIQNIGTLICLDVDAQLMTIEESMKLCDALRHCIKKAVQARDESENTGTGVEDVTK